MNAHLNQLNKYEIFALKSLVQNRVCATKGLSHFLRIFRLFHHSGTHATCGCWWPVVKDHKSSVWLCTRIALCVHCAITKNDVWRTFVTTYMSVISNKTYAPEFINISKMREHCEYTVNIFALVCTRLMCTHIIAIYITCIAFTTLLGICKHCEQNLVRSFHPIYIYIKTRTSIPRCA